MYAQLLSLLAVLLYHKLTEVTIYRHYFYSQRELTVVLFSILLVALYAIQTPLRVALLTTLVEDSVSWLDPAEEYVERMEDGLELHHSAEVNRH